MTQFEMVTRRATFQFPSLNFTAAEADESRQFVIVMFSHANAGPQTGEEIKMMQSSPVSMTQFEIRTSRQPSRSMPSAQTPSFRLVYA